MKKVLTFLLCMVAVSFATIDAQTYDEKFKSIVSAKLNKYDKTDDIVKRIDQVVKLFDEGKPLSVEFLSENQKLLGVTYILFERLDCIGTKCIEPAVSPAAFQILDGQIGMMGLGKMPTASTKRPLSDFVQKYFDGQISLSDSREMNFLMKNRVLPDGIFPYENDKYETIILDESNSFARVNGNDLIIMTISNDKRNIMIYSYRLNFFETETELYRKTPNKK